MQFGSSHFRQSARTRLNPFILWRDVRRINVARILQQGDAGNLFHGIAGTK